MTVFVENSTSIHVAWNEVPAIDRNGIITQYEVMYEPLETFGGQLSADMNFTDVSTLGLSLQNLEENIQYNFTVRAYTNAGAGVSSSNMIVTTFEDGNLICYSHWPVFIDILEYQSITVSFPYFIPNYSSLELS